MKFRDIQTTWGFPNLENFGRRSKWCHKTRGFSAWKKQPCLSLAHWGCSFESTDLQFLRDDLTKERHHRLSCFLNPPSLPVFFWNSTCFQLECSTLLTYLIPFGGQYRLPAHAPHAVSISPWLSDDAAWKLTPREKGDLFLEIIASGYMLNTFMVLELKHCYTGLWIF